MKKFILLASLLAAQSAYAEDGLYVSLGAGIGKITTAKSTQDFPLLLKSPGFFSTGIEGSMTLSFKNAIHFNGALGYKAGDFRVEIEPVYLKAKYKKFDQEPFGIRSSSNLSGYVRSISGFVNGYYDVSVHDTFVPYVGAGVGYARIKNKLGHAGLVDVLPGGAIVTLPTLKFTMNDRSLAYQGILGVMINITEQIALIGDYRFSSTTKKMTALNSKLKGHFVNLGLLYKF